MLVSEEDMKGITVCGRMNGDRLDAHLLARPDNPTRNLPAIGDQDFAKLACAHNKFKVQGSRFKVQGRDSSLNFEL